MTMLTRVPTGRRCHRLPQVPPSIAAELHGQLPWIDGRYATASDCNDLQKFERAGEAGGLVNSRWHLNPDGFTDAHESSCEFIGVITKGDTAIVHASCVAGAEQWPETYAIYRDTSSGRSVLYVHSGESEKGREGEEYIACPPG